MDALTPATVSNDVKLSGTPDGDDVAAKTRERRKKRYVPPTAVPRKDVGFRTALRNPPFGSMRLLCIGVSAEIMEQSALALQMRWPELRIDTATSGESGIDMVRRRNPDVVMVQGRFQDMSLNDAIRGVRRHTDKPIIVWGAEQGEMEAVRSLESGADEYMRPQVGLMELVARVLALLRRSQLFPSSEGAAPAVSGPLHVEPKTMDARMDGRSLGLTPTEFKLLLALMRNRGSVVSRRYLEQNLWDSRSDAQSLVKKYVQRLREKLGDSPAAPRWIANVPGVGYRFIGPPDGREQAGDATLGAQPARQPDHATP
jgi:two-component system KDP operon response regulator KdpE